MLSVTSIEPTPFQELRYLNAGCHGRTPIARLGFFRGRVRSLPEGCDALVLTSDLQGMAPGGWRLPARLLGVAVAEELCGLDLGRMGIVLAGDLYSVPEANKRGGWGDVSSVWRAFAEVGERVVGVAGNHDDVSRVRTTSTICLLDGHVVTLGGMRIGGVGLVCGNDEKKGRRDESEQLERIANVADTDVLILHEGPCVEDEPGNIAVCDLLADARIPLVICGHRAWSKPLAALSSATQVVNTHERVIVLTD